MENIVFSLNILILIILVAVTFTISYFLLRKYIFFWFDPLLLYIIFNSFSIAFVLYLYFFEKQIKGFYIITYFLSTIGFFTGLMIGSKKALKKISVIKTNNDLVFNNYDQVFDFFLMVCIFIVVGSNLIMLASVGTLPI